MAKADQATALLVEQLASGPRLAADLQQMAGERGISSRTLQRARESLGVVPRRARPHPSSPWVWALPDTATAPPTPAPSPSLAGADYAGYEGRDFASVEERLAFERLDVAGEAAALELAGRMGVPFGFEITLEGSPHGLLEFTVTLGPADRWPADDARGDPDVDGDEEANDEADGLEGARDGNVALGSASDSAPT